VLAPGELVIEVRFKGARKDYYRAGADVPLEAGDYCVVQADRGKECGKVVETGLLASMRSERQQLGDVVRRATADDMTIYWDNASKESRARTFCLTRIVSRRLDMKLVDVEWQFDSTKVTFFFTADRRVDFRELVKDLASEFRTRIELRQIGVRDEAKRRDGYGSCGRRLCCSSWLPEFQPITLKMARDQQLSLSPNKISGLCGRLLCCLSYEVKQYRDVMKGMPPVGALVKAGTTEGYVTKIDVFNRRIHVRDGEGKDNVIPDNAWRPEFMVAAKPGRRPKDERGERGERGDRGGRATGRPARPGAADRERNPQAEHTEDDLRHLEDEPPSAQ
jgi:cell fate regulator YaaT (PSP1 superfamily)